MYKDDKRSEREIAGWRFGACGLPMCRVDLTGSGTVSWQPAKGLSLIEFGFPSFVMGRCHFTSVPLFKRSASLSSADVLSYSHSETSGEPIHNLCAFPVLVIKYIYLQKYNLHNQLK